MSWSDPPSRRRALGLLALALPGLGLLAGCGFQPLYGKTQQGMVTDDFAAIRIAPLGERSGQMLHNLLRDRLNPYGQPTVPRYELQIALTESGVESGIQRDETATRVTLRMSADFSLIDLQSGEVVTKGLSRASSGFNILDNRYASTVSAEDARERALTVLADDIRLRLAAYFAGQRAA